MGASSMLSPSTADRTFLNPYASDHMQLMHSTPPMFYQSLNNPPILISEPGLAAEPSSGSSIYDLNSQSSNPQFQVASSPQPPNGLYITYQPKNTENAEQKIRPPSDVNGHYNSFYPNAATSNDQTEQGYLAANLLTNQQSALSEAAASNNNNFQPAPTYDNNPPYAQQQATRVMTTSGYNQQQDLLSASQESPNVNTAQQPPYQARFNTNPASTSRRSGAVTLKMNEATRARLQQQLQRQHSRRQIVEHYLPTVYYPSVAKPQPPPSSNLVADDINNNNNNRWPSDNAFIPMTSSASEPSSDFILAGRPGKSARKSALEVDINGLETAPTTATATSGIGEPRHASPNSNNNNNDKLQQGQSIPKTPLTYMIIRPKKTILGAKSPLAATADAETPKTVHRVEPMSEFVASNQVDSNRPGSSDLLRGPENSWHSASDTAMMKQEAGSSRQKASFNEEPLQWSASSLVSAQNDQPQQVFGDSNNNDNNNKFGRSRIQQVSLSNPSSIAQTENLSPAASRLSRTGSAVSQQHSSSSSSSRVKARRPSESLTDYGIAAIAPEIAAANSQRDGQTTAPVATKPSPVDMMTGEPDRLSSGRASSNNGAEQAAATTTTLGGLHELTAPSSHHETTVATGIQSAAGGGGSQSLAVAAVESSVRNWPQTDDSTKTNLIQLGNGSSESENDVALSATNNNNGNNVKQLIESANANNAGEFSQAAAGQTSAARAHYESASSVVMLPSSAADESTMTSADNDSDNATDHHHHHHQRHQNNSNNQQQQQRHNAAAGTGNGDEEPSAMKTLVAVRERPYEK